MKKPLRIFLTILAFVVVDGAFASTCACTYIYHWNVTAFWWSWFLIVWLVDVFVGCYIFYKPNRTDETKTFWLFVMVLIPIVGACIALIYNYKLKTLFSQPNNDHTKLQSIIFRARKSIRIYSDSFFVSLDTFKALNYARWKGVKVEIVLSMQEKKSRQDFLIYTLQKYLEKNIDLYFINKQIDESFIVVDNEECLSTTKNFNFRNVYRYKTIVSSDNPNRFINIWNYDWERCSKQSLKKEKINPFINVKYKLINIFYPFF